MLKRLWKVAVCYYCGALSPTHSSWQHVSAADLWTSLQVPTEPRGLLLWNSSAFFTSQYLLHSPWSIEKGWAVLWYIISIVTALCRGWLTQTAAVIMTITKGWPCLYDCYDADMLVYNECNTDYMQGMCVCAVDRHGCDGWPLYWSLCIPLLMVVTHLLRLIETPRVHISLTVLNKTPHP